MEKNRQLMKILKNSKNKIGQSGKRMEKIEN